ncbi:MAG: selenocysteine-specific translation elongation factor [Thermoanaerobaculia bacterium]
MARRRIIGTAGHIDHGKTALVRALTGVDCDRLPEEKRRGITIDLGFASWMTGEFQISFIDVPGHERFVRNMLAGVGGIDSALLVVAADESVMPQTREHFAICRLLHIPTGVVAITKGDLVDADTIEVVRLEVEQLVAGSFLDGQPIVPVSSVTGSGIEELKEALVRSVEKLEDRDVSHSVFRLPIDRKFSMKGFGSVITGTTISGSLATESEVVVLPGEAKSRARAIQVHGEPRETAYAGERTSVNLADLALDEIHRGQQVVVPGTLDTSQILTAEIELLADSAPLKEQTRIRFHHYSAELLGTIRIVDDSGDAIPPGGRAYVQIRLESPVVAVAGDRFVIRRYSPAITIGGGRVLDPHLPKLRRGTRRELLDTLGSDAFGPRFVLLARFAGLAGLSLRDLRARTGLQFAELESRIAASDTAALRRIGDGAQARWIHEDHLRDLRKRAMALLEDYFRVNRVAVGVPKGEFTQRLLGSAPPTLHDYLMADLTRERIIELRGDAVTVPGRSDQLGGAEGELARAIEMRFLEAGLRSMPVSELINTISQKPKVIDGVVSYLVKRGTLVRLAEGIYLHAEVLREARERIVAEKGKTIDVGWFKEFFGLSRKVAIPLLEYFDRAGVTRRTGDSRLVL